MTRIRPYVRHKEVQEGKMQVDVHIHIPAGGPDYREQRVYVGGKQAARRWAKAREDAVEALANQQLDAEAIYRALRKEEETELTVEAAVNAWLDQRKAEGVPSHTEEKQRLHDYVLPVIGGMKVSEVKPKHAYQLIKELERTPSRRGGVLAPRTVRNAFFATRQVFQHLVLQEVIPGNPMTVERGVVLPHVKDKDPTWRVTAVFTAAEVEQLISSEKIPAHRRVAYALEFLTGLRTGQASAVRWGDYDLDTKPLGKITSALSYNSRRKVVKETKTGAVHEVPVHPTLRRVLAAWKLTGWRQRMGRAPKSDDLIIPTKRGTHRNVRKALQAFHEDLKTLGMRLRRHYDSRATFISLGLDGGASKDILQSITHPRPRDAFDLYRRESWESKCEAVSKVKVELHPDGGEVVALSSESEGPLDSVGGP